MQLDNSSGGLRSYSPQQWHWFKEQLANMESGNLFIIMPRPVWGKKGFTDKLEAELFNSYLSELFTAKKINVYVLTGGEDKITYEVRSGVKYLTVSGTDVNLTATSGLENQNYLRFTSQKPDKFTIKSCLFSRYNKDASLSRKERIRLIHFPEISKGQVRLSFTELTL